MTSSSSAVAGLGPGFGPVASVTLSDASTTATYDAVVISQYQNIQTPTVVAITFPEYNSVGSVTSVFGSVIIGKGGTALIHPPHLPTPGGLIGPPGFGGPIRPPSGSSGCPSFFGISFCPPSFNIDPPGFPGVDPADLPEGPDPENPDDSENNESQTKDDPSSTQATKTQTSASTPSSVSASTTASSSSASSSASTSCSACDTCVTYDYAPDATPNPLDDDSNQMKKRALAGRFVHNKRGNNYQTVVTGAVASGKCPVAKFTMKPSYPGPGVVANNEGNPAPEMAAFYQTATYWAVPTQPPKCGAPGWDYLNTEEIGAAKPPWSLGGKGKSVNIDHVYEVSILDEFFASQNAADGGSCKVISALFDQPDSANAPGSRLNTVFGQLPSLINPDFLGMDAALNRLKGSFWNPGLTGADLKAQNGNAAVQALSNLAVVMSIANDAKVSGLFSATNARIYSAFLGIDALITAQQGCSNPIEGSDGKPVQATWANAYKAYITAKVASQNDLITKTASAISATISTDVEAAPQKSKGVVKNWSSFVSNFNAKYQVNALTFPEPQDWPNNAMNIQKRDGAACTRQPSANPSVSITSGSTGASGTATSGASTGGAGASTGGASTTSGSASAGATPSTTGTSPTTTTGGTSSSAVPAATSSYACYPFSDPDAGPAPPQCQCDGLDGFYPTISSSSGQTSYNECGYTTSPTKASATSVPGFTTTQSDGEVVSCASSTYFNYAVNTIPTCAGSTSVISTVASIASVYSVSSASAASVAASSASSASAASAYSSAAAVPSAGCWILSDDGFGDSSFEIYGINGWAGQDGSKLWDQEDGCGIVSGGEFYPNEQSEFMGQLRDTQSAYFGLSFFKGGCVERAVHSAGGPPPGNGPGQLACQHASSLSDDQSTAVGAIAGPQLKAVQAVANGSSATSSSKNSEKFVVDSSDSSSKPDPSLVASASAALPALSAAASAASPT